MIKFCLSLKDKIRKEGKDRKRDVVVLQASSPVLVVLVSSRLVLDLLSLHEVSEEKKRQRERLRE